MSSLFILKNYYLYICISKYNVFEINNILSLKINQCFFEIVKTKKKYFSKIYVPSQFCYDIFSKQLSIPIEKVKLKSMIHDYVDKIDNHIIKNEIINKILV